MNIKKFIAPSMSEAMNKIKYELGENAVILQSKVVYRGGFLGIFRKKNFEVVAAIEEYTIHKNVKQRSPIKQKYERPLQLSQSHDRVGHQHSTISADQVDILTDMNQLKNELLKIKQQQLNFLQYPDLIQSRLLHLQQTGIADEYINDMADCLLEKWRNSPVTPNNHHVNEWCRDYLLDSLSEISCGDITYDKKFINFVGPTGVGKTTTIAKLAAAAILDHKKKVGFITTDTYRIAAIEQLKTYAELLDIPVEVIYSPEDFHHAAEKLAHVDVIFIDTAGRNYRNEQYITELRKMLDLEEGMETFLVLSLSMKEQDMLKIVENFSTIDVDQYIFTKADETRTYGAMYNLMRTYRMGAGYITTGQDVPDDIIHADHEVIVDYLLKDEEI